MSEDTNLLNKPKKLWNDTLKLVKGEDTARLVEQFTEEMTLVAEGLCEDQNRLRGEINRTINEEDRRLQQLDSRIGEMETLLTDHEKEYDRTVTELRNRLAVLEKESARETKERERQKTQKEQKSRNLIRELTILITVAAVAVIVVSLVLKYA